MVDGRNNLESVWHDLVVTHFIVEIRQARGRVDKLRDIWFVISRSVSEFSKYMNDILGIQLNRRVPFWKTLFFTRTSNFWAEAECSFKNIYVLLRKVKTILRILASNVLKMFLYWVKIIVNIGCTSVNFQQETVNKKRIEKHSCTCWTLWPWMR